MLVSAIATDGQANHSHPIYPKPPAQKCARKPLTASHLEMIPEYDASGNGWIPYRPLSPSQTAVAIGSCVGALAELSQTANDDHGSARRNTQKMKGASCHEEYCLTGMALE